MNDVDFRQKIARYICQNCAIGPDDRLLVALSGGADSVALLRVLLDLGYRCGAAHCNFHLRGEESVRDEHFVRELCHRLGVSLVVRDFDVEGYRPGRNLSVEMACRELRYQWFTNLLDSGNFAAVAVAHHQDDNIETMFLNLLRGTGINGLKGMRPRNGVIVRPLLCVSRQEVEDYLSDIGQDYVTDSTNRQNVYLRNKVRNLLLPTIDSEFPEGRQRIIDTMRNVDDFQGTFSEMAADYWYRHRMTHAEGLECYSLKHLSGMRHAVPLLYHLLSGNGFNIAQCQQILNDPHEQISHFYSSTHTLTLDGHYLVIEEIENEHCDEFHFGLCDIDELPVNIEFYLCKGPVNVSELDGKYAVAFSAELMKCRRFTLRHWRRGDRICPYGMNGKSRLLSDMFNDAHLTLQQKRRVWVLEADGVVLWVLGLRASHDYRVLPDSSGYFRLIYKP